MARIKSTLELALERAKAIEMSSDHLEEVHRKDLEEKAGSVVKRFLEDPEWTVRKLEDFVQAQAGQDRAAAREIILALLIANIGAASWERALDGLSALPPPIDEALLREARANLVALQGEVTRCRASKVAEITDSARVRMREELEQCGIRGSAIIQTPPAAQVEEEVGKALETRYAPAFQRIRKMLRSGASLKEEVVS